MMNATEEMEKHRFDANERILDQRIAHFIRKWRPRESHDAIDFDMEFHNLLRSAYAQAAVPYQKTMDAMLRSMPTPALFGSPKESLK